MRSMGAKSHAVQTKLLIFLFGSLTAGVATFSGFHLSRASCRFPSARQSSENLCSRLRARAPTCRESLRIPCGLNVGRGANHPRAALRMCLSTAQPSAPGGGGQPGREVPSTLTRFRALRLRPRKPGTRRTCCRHCSPCRRRLLRATP